MSAGAATAPMAQRAAPSPRILVLGYGNLGRKDDGLGPMVADAIAAEGLAGVTTWENDQLAIEDALDIASHDVIWFVDAARAGPEPWSIERVTPAMDLAFTSHILSPQTLLAIARQEFGAVPEAYLLAIRGYDFSFAEGLSHQAARNLASAVAALRGRIASLRESVS